MRWIFVVAAMAVGAAPALAEEIGADTKAYLARVLTERGFAQKEFEAATRAFPFFAVYILGTAAANDCSFSSPSKQLYDAADGDSFVKTEEGKKVFIVATAVASMSFDTVDAKRSFCDSTKKLVEEAEKLAAKQ